MIKVNDVEVNSQATFPDGSLAIKAPELALYANRKIKIEWRYENDAELFALICLRRHYWHHEVVLFMNYVPHARMDRVKNSNDIFTLKYFCEVINSLNFSAVVITDPHSYVAPALLDNVVEMSIQSILDDVLDKFDNGNTVLFFPDEGAMKRYAGFQPSYPFAFGMKKRDWTTGDILSLDIVQAENIVGKDVLIIDDICSRGGTFIHSAKALLAAGAKSVSLYITHCENTILKGEIFNSGLFEQVYTTESLVHCDELKEKIIYV